MVVFAFLFAGFAAAGAENGIHRFIRATDASCPVSISGMEEQSSAVVETDQTKEERPLKKWLARLKVKSLAVPDRT